MTAVFRVRLSKHIKFDIIRVTAKAAKRILQIINFVFRQCQTETHVSVDQRLTPFTQQIHTLHRRRLMMLKQTCRIRFGGKYGLHHAVMQLSRHACPLRFGQCRSVNVVRYTALQAIDFAKVAVMRDIRCFRRPGGDGARTGRNEK